MHNIKGVAKAIPFIYNKFVPRPNTYMNYMLILAAGVTTNTNLY